MPGLSKFKINKELTIKTATFTTAQFYCYFLSNKYTQKSKTLRCFSLLTDLGIMKPKSNSHSNVGRFTWRSIGREKFSLSLNIMAQTLELELD